MRNNKDAVCLSSYVFAKFELFFYLFFSLLVLSSLVSYDFYGLRLSDLIMLFGVLFLAYFRLLIVKVEFVLVVFGVLSILLVSDFLSYLSVLNNFHLGKSIFYYKYLAVVLIFIYFYSFSLKFWEKVKTHFPAVYMLFFLLLVVWVLLSVLFLGSDFLDSNGRPSFPLASDYSVSDAHLLSSVLGLSLIFYFFVRHAFKVTIVLDIIIFSLAPIAMVLTGSRTAFAMLSIFFVTMSYFILIKVILLQRASVLFLFMFFGISFVGCVFLFYFPYVEFSFLSKFRAFNFNLIADESSNIRVAMLFQALDEASKNYYLLGAGVASSSALFYDGVLSILIAHGGFLLVFLVLLVIVLCACRVLALRNVPFKYKAYFLSVLTACVVANVITEYVFVTRGAVPFLSILVYLYCFMRREFYLS